MCIRQCVCPMHDAMVEAHRGRGGEGFKAKMWRPSSGSSCAGIGAGNPTPPPMHRHAYLFMVQVRTLQRARKTNV